MLVASLCAPPGRGLAQPASAASTPAGSATAAEAPGRLDPVVVPLTMNGVPREPVMVLLEGGLVWFPVADLLDAGLLPQALPASAVRSLRGADHVRLDTVPQTLRHTYDPAQLSLVVDLLPAAMAATRLETGRRRDTPRAPRVPSAYLNYSLLGSQSGPPSLILEAVTSLQGHSGRVLMNRDGDGTSWRGPASLTVNDDARRQQWIIGDATWPGVGLIGGQAVGGLTWQSFYGFDPGFVTSPGLDLNGAALTPSTVDVYVNGALVARRQVPPGPFTLANIAAQTGSNNVTAVVRDAFGRETTLSLPGYYGSPTLLRPGLSTFAVSAGTVRTDAARQGPSYGTPVLLAQASTGLTRAVTLGGVAQWTQALQVAGAHLAATGPWGEAGAQAAASHVPEQGGGMALSLSYRLSTPAWSLGASLARRQRSFQDLATQLFPAARNLRVDELSLGRSLLGTDVSLRWSALDRADGDRSRRLSLTATRRWTAAVSTSLELARTTGTLNDTSLFLLTAISLDTRQSLYLGTSQNRGTTTLSADLVNAPQEALQTGWRLSTSTAGDVGQARQGASVTRDTRFGDYELQLSRAGGITSSFWRASGALLAIDGTLAAAPPVRDAFALVRVPGTADVPVRVEGRLAGLTGRDGTLVLPNVASYSGQRVSIDAEALPPDVEVGSVELRADPPLRGGEVLRFDVKLYRASTGRLLTPEGQPVASAVIVLPDGRRVSTGTGGDFVIEGAPAAGAALVERAAGVPPCRITLPPDTGTSPVRRLGELRCMP